MKKLSVKNMKEKILTVLVVVALILSAFNLVLMLRTNSTEIVGQQSSNVTWKKAQLNTALVYEDYVDGVLCYSAVPLWNVTLTLQWSNSTISIYELGNAIFYNQGYVVATPKGTTLFYGHIVDSSFYYPDTSPTANVTSLTAYEIQPPQS